MFGIFTKKDRRIANLEAMVKNRDILIKDITEQNAQLKNMIESLKQDFESIKEQSFKYANKIRRPNLVKARQNKKHLVKGTLQTLEK